MFSWSGIQHWCSAVPPGPDEKKCALQQLPQQRQGQGACWQVSLHTYLLIWLAERVCCLILLLLQISRYIYPISLAEQDFFTNLGFTHPDLFQVLPCHFNTQSSIQVNNVNSTTKKAFIIILYFIFKLNFIIFEFIF